MDHKGKIWTWVEVIWAKIMKVVRNVPRYDLLGLFINFVSLLNLDNYTSDLLSSIR